MYHRISGCNDDPLRPPIHFLAASVPGGYLQSRIATASAAPAKPAFAALTEIASPAKMLAMRSMVQSALTQTRIEMGIGDLPAALLLCCALAIIAAGVFLAFPQLDLAVTHIFYGERHAFYGTTLSRPNFPRNIPPRVLHDLRRLRAGLHQRAALRAQTARADRPQSRVSGADAGAWPGPARQRPHQRAFASPAAVSDAGFRRPMAVSPVRPFRRAVRDGLLVRFGRDFDRRVEPRAGAVDAAALARGGDRRLAPVHCRSWAWSASPMAATTSPT